MNDRIRKLLMQAFQNHYGDPVTPDAREAAIKMIDGVVSEFAELIVKECADAADMAPCRDIGDYVCEQLGYGEDRGVCEWRMK